MKVFVPVALAAIVIGCTPVVPLATTTGHADVLFAAPKKQVLAEILALCVEKGYQVKKSEEYLLVLGKADDSMASAVLFGSRYDATPEKRLTLTVVERDGACRVMAQFAMVTNPGSAFERVNPAPKNSRADHEFQQALLQIKAKIEK